MKQDYTEADIAQLEQDVLDRARELGRVGEAEGIEYARLIAAGKSSYEAWRLSSAAHALDMDEAEARYEIALERLRRAK